MIRAVNINPNIISIQSNLGNAYAMKGENDKAIIAYQKAISLGAKDPITHFNLAATYFNLKKYDMAWRYARIAERLGYPSAKNLIKMLMEVSKEPE
jgi:tetratricopeptide (TPR) repeat protein